jgi:hypothetical protein
VREVLLDEFPVESNAVIEFGIIEFAVSDEISDMTFFAISCELFDIIVAA